MLGYLLIGVLLGMISAGISLFLGVVYYLGACHLRVAGLLGSFLSAAIVYIWSRSFKGDIEDTWLSDTNCHFRLPDCF